MIIIKPTNKENLPLLENDKNIYKPNSFLYFQNKKGLDSFSEPTIAISSLVKVPVQNRNNYSIIKDSSISSFLDYSDQIKILAKEKGKKKYQNVINHFLTTSNNIIQYLESPSSVNQQKEVSIAISPEHLTWVEKKNKIMDIKHNTESFIAFNSTLFSYNYFTLKRNIKYYLEDVIKDILNSNLSKKDKKLFRKLLNKFNKRNKLNSKLNIKKINSKQKYQLKKKRFNRNYPTTKILKNKTYVTLKTIINSKLNIKKINSKQKYQLKKKFNNFKGINKKRVRFNNKSLVYSLRLKKNLPSIKQTGSGFYPKRLQNGGVKETQKAEMNRTRQGLLPNSSTLSSFVGLDQKGQERSQQKYLSNENAKIIWLLNNKSLIEDYFKLRNLGSIDQYKEKHSLNYKRLSLEDKKIVDALIFIDCYKNAPISFVSTDKKEEVGRDSYSNSVIVMPKTSFIKSISPFNPHLAQSNNIMYFFNKKNNYNIFKNEQNIRDILEAAFLSMNTFISKAYFSVKPNSILINLFFYWMVDVDSLLAFSLKKNIKRNKITNIKINKKMNSNKNITSNKKRFNNRNSYRKSQKIKNLLKRGNLALAKGKRSKKILILLENNIKKNMRFSNKFSRFAVLFEKKIKRLTWVLTKLLNKRVNFQFTRVFYPYNDCNILLFLLGFVGFWVKFNRIVLELILNINFKIKKKRYLKLKYRNIPSVVTGLNIKLAGRISKVRSKKRVKTLKWNIGSLARSVDKLKVNNKFTNKTVAGAFNISMQHNATVLK
jgi:hypothetical protein